MAIKLLRRTNTNAGVVTCGTQHANMLLRVSVDSPDEFEAWLANQEKDAVEPANERLLVPDRTIWS